MCAILLQMAPTSTGKGPALRQRRLSNVLSDFRNKNGLSTIVGGSEGALCGTVTVTVTCHERKRLDDRMVASRNRDRAIQSRIEINPCLH